MKKIIFFLIITLYLNATEYNSYIESRVGSRIYDNKYSKQLSVSQIRYQIDVEQEYEDITFNLVSDFIADTLANEYKINLNEGKGFIDLRQANMELTPFEWLDLKIGRQIITWGTGDLLFINDLFAKDWNAFLSGLNTEYLKAPSDSIKASLFFGDAALDIVYSLQFSADRYINGDKISFFDRASNDLRGEDKILEVNRPKQFFKDDEIAMRLYQSFQGYETALYYYKGFHKSPSSYDINTNKAGFGDLEVIGASLRGVLFNGIANAEMGYYKSEDNAKSNPFKKNSEFRWLLGYEQEIATELTVGVQYYEEIKRDYNEYITALSEGAIKDDKTRKVLSLRLTKLLLKQDLKLSYFQFHSQSDNDGYVRVNLSYKFTDNLISEGGTNIFYGKEKHTFYKQFRENSNTYISLKYIF